MIRRKQKDGTISAVVDQIGPFKRVKQVNQDRRKRYPFHIVPFTDRDFIVIDTVAFKEQVKLMAHVDEVAVEEHMKQMAQ